MSINLKQDWVKDRDKDTFVSRFDKDGFDWKDDVEEGEGLSGLIYDIKGMSVNDLVEKSYKIAKTRLGSMGLFKTSIGLSSTGANYTDGKRIVVSTQVMDDPKLSESKRMDVFLGEVVHEGAHLLYTDFNITPKKLSNTLKTIWNIVEDEYIEREIGKFYPGYSNYLAATKARLIGGQAIEPTGSVITDIINVFFGFIRYPGLITDEMIDKYGGLMEKIHKLFAKGYPTSTEECFKVSKKVHKMLKKYYEDHEDEKEEPKAEEKEEVKDPADGEGDGDGGKGTGEEPDNCSGEDSEEGGDDKSDSKSEPGDDKGEGGGGGLDPEEEEEEAAEEGDDKGTGKPKKGEAAETDATEKKSEGSEGDGEKPEPGEDEKSEKESEESDKEYDAEVVGVVQTDDDGNPIAEEPEEDRDFDKDSDEYAGEIIKSLDSSLDPKSKKEVNESRLLDETKLMEITGMVVIEGKCVFIPVKSTVEYTYLERREVVRTSIGTLSKQLILDSFQMESKLRGLRTGALDAAKIVEASAGVPTVYTKTVEKLVRTATVALVIDESGSMSSGSKNPSGKYIRRIDTAGSLAILFNEALDKAGIDHFIYGHNADDISQDGVEINETGTYITVYKEPGKKFNKKSLGNIQSRCCNRDGVAFRGIADRIRKITQEPVFMIIISDGQPSAVGYSGIGDTRKAIKEITKNKFFPIGIGIQAHYPMESIYDYHVKFEDLSTFPRDVGKLLRKLIKTSYK